MKSPKFLATAAAFLAAALWLPSVASAYPLSVTRTSADTDQIVSNPASGFWSGGNFKITSTVSLAGVENGLQKYLYEYIIDAAVRDISHIIIETSPDIGDDIALNTITGGTVSGPGLFKPGSGNPGMPGDIYGFKVDLTPAAQDYSFSFYSFRAPVWGDFYAKDGKTGGPGGGEEVYAYNKMFGTNPSNPLDPNVTAANVGSADYKGWIITPDTRTTVVIPEPSSLAIAGLGGLGLIGYAWRRPQGLTGLTAPALKQTPGWFGATLRPPFTFAHHDNSLPS